MSWRREMITGLMGAALLLPLTTVIAPGSWPRTPFLLATLAACMAAAWLFMRDQWSRHETIIEENRVRDIRIDSLRDSVSRIAALSAIGRAERDSAIDWETALRELLSREGTDG